MPQYISYNGFGHPNESNSVIANAMGLLKLILHFWFFLSLTNIICVGVCGSIVHIQTVHTSPTDPNFTFLCSTSSSPFQSHWNLSSSFGLTCYKIKEKIKNGIWHVEIGKKFAKNDMTKNFMKHNPNYSSGRYKISKISEIVDLPNSK